MKRFRLETLGLLLLAFMTFASYEAIGQSNPQLSSKMLRAIASLFDQSGFLTTNKLLLTAGTMTPEQTPQAQIRDTTSSFTWTNAQVVALGAALTGDITVATLPAKTVVNNAYVVITGQGAGTATLTVACGRTGAAYIDYIVASDAKAAANTVYGDASAERGTNLVMYDLPSYTATTDVKCHFISTVQNLDQTTGSTGRVILTTTLAP